MSDFFEHRVQREREALRLAEEEGAARSARERERSERLAAALASEARGAVPEFEAGVAALISADAPRAAVTRARPTLTPKPTRREEMTDLHRADNGTWSNHLSRTWASVTTRERGFLQKPCYEWAHRGWELDIHESWRVGEKRSQGGFVLISLDGEVSMRHHGDALALEDAIKKGSLRNAFYRDATRTQEEWEIRVADLLRQSTAVIAGYIALIR